MRTEVSQAPARAQAAGAQFDQAAVQSTANHPSRRFEAADRPTELDILEKPRPEYTEEARRLRIEGDVLVQALFEASGRIRILRIVRGLGHGLDESAVRAATAIRFRPAMERGRATDTVAVVHIQFQLAY
jgi:TonB family protein